jgi:spore coat protein U-like protein
MALRFRDTARLPSPRFIAVALTSALIYLGATTAHAQTCSVSAASGNYGAVNVLAGSAVTTSSTFTMTCSGCVLGCTVNARIQFNQGSPNGNTSIRHMGNGANTAQHELYSDSGLTQVWGSWGYGTTAYGTTGVSTNLTLPALGGSTSQTLLEISGSDSIVRDRQFQQRLSDLADEGYRRLVDEDDLDLCGLQSCRCTDFIPGGISVGQTGP